MPWTATLTSAAIDRGNIVPVVEFKSDTGETISQDFRGDDVTADRLGQLVAMRVASLEARDAAFATLQDLVGQVITPASPDEATAEVKAFLALRSKLASLKQSVTEGLTKPDDPSISELEAAVKTAYKPEYAIYIR